MKVICVDDEPLAVEYTLGQCSLLPEIEEAKGFTEAQSALDWLQNHSADLAILDINMPEIDGITLAARIKQARPETAILFLTAYKDYCTRTGETSKKAGVINSALENAGFKRQKSRNGVIIKGLRLRQA